MLLKDKTVVIFGGSGAIGRAAALAMAKESARIFLARQADKLEKAAAEIRAAGGSVETLQLDVLDGGQTTAQVANRRANRRD